MDKNACFKKILAGRPVENSQKSEVNRYSKIR